MKITIRELNPDNLKDVNQCDGEFTIQGRVSPWIEDGEYRYKIIDIPKREKRYDIEEVDYAAYLDNPDKTVYLAYADGQIAGQIILRKNWNNFAWVEDIVVDRQFRRQGVGVILLEKAVWWARDKGLVGVMLGPRTTT